MFGQSICSPHSANFFFFLFALLLLFTLLELTSDCSLVTQEAFFKSDIGTSFTMQLFSVLWLTCLWSLAQGRRVRLLGGSDSCSGRVEAYLYGQWGRLCYHDWDIADAQVVCRELGCGSSFSATADFGKGPGLVHPYRVMCTGQEPSLHNCLFMRGNIVQCFSDAGVRCTGTGETTPAMPTTPKPRSLDDSLKPGIEVYVQYGNSGKYVVVCSSQQYIGEGAVHLEIVSQKTYTLQNPVCSRENMCLFSVDETPPVSFTCVQKTQDSGHGPLTLTSDSQTVSSPGPKHSFSSMSSFSKAYTAFIVIGVTGMIIAIFVTELKARRTDPSRNSIDNHTNHQDVSH
uniref:Uncharacterized LOC107076742 n=1 Tax=Lepisosteus oculatus TaxID=7918 RepID=W5NEV3_LEPOC|nr:PREDICTED: uncharacterized protein LOC107076742 isoform X2 [Lepisosteus oculatus]